MSFYLLSLMAKPAPATDAELKQAYAKFVETQQKDAKRMSANISLLRQTLVMMPQLKNLLKMLKIQGGLSFARNSSSVL